jgi:hypothetical protein
VAQVHTVRCVPARARGLGTACARGGGVAFFRAAIEGQPLFRSFVISTGGSFSIHRSVKLAPENSSLRRSKHGASSAAHGSGPPFTQQRMLLQEAMQ